MSVLLDNNAFRKAVLGLGPVSKSTGTLAATTISLFTVGTGMCAITSLFGYVGTAITVANSYKLQHNPTTGTTSDLVAATDIGTTDTPAGNVLAFDGVKTSSIQTGPGSAPTLFRPIIVTPGIIESVSAGTDGEITWYLTWVPLENGATIVAA